MLIIRDRLAGDEVRFHYVESARDLRRVRDFILRCTALGIDTESTGLNCYRPDWRLRTVQYGDDFDSFVVPARYRKFIAWTMKQKVNWIGHNGPHDIRCIDQHLGYDTGVICAGETYIPSHHMDSRAARDGGIGHGLKELAIAHVDRNAGKWEKALKEEFKKIEVPIPGEVYKSGKRKGQPKVRKAKMSEGWALIDPRNPAYIAYAAADPVLTIRMYRKLQPIVREYHDLYQFDHRVQIAVDRLQRRAIRCDVPYTEDLSEQYLRKATEMEELAAGYGCDNIQSGKQVADTLIRFGAELTERTDSGQYKTDARILRALMNDPYSNAKVRDFVHAVLLAKQLHKRRASYTEAMLREMDAHGRVHPSINSLAARTARMSVSSPALQQLPTKDHEDDVFWDLESEDE